MMHRVLSGVYVLLFTFLLVSSARAEVVLTRIQDVINPEPGNEDYLVLSVADGRVYGVNAQDRVVLDRIADARNKGNDVRLILDGDRVVAVGAVPVEVENKDALIEPSLDVAFSMDSWRRSEGVDAGYTPSVFTSLSDARSLFNSMETLRGSSQCYQRAHYWAYSMWRKKSVRSLKVFLFFTHSYIKRYKYKWWFHVAPFVLVSDKEIVLDPTFTDDVKEMRAWTDQFMKNKVECETVVSYSDYEDNQQTADCYLRKVPMYYYQPFNVEARDENGEIVTAFREKEVKHAERAKPWF